MIHTTRRTTTATMTASGACLLALTAMLAFTFAPRLGAAQEAGKAPGDAGKAKADAAAPMLVWDGTNKAEGSGWAGPEGGKVTLEKEANAGRDGKGDALRFRASGKDWFGGGWNWRGWYPEDEGDDVRPYKNLVLWVKMTVEQGEQTVSPYLVLISAGGGTTGNVELRSYAPNLADGKWHEVVIPLADLTKGNRDAAAKEFDPAKVWEVNLGAWAEGERSLTIWIDDIGFDNREAASKAK